MKRLVCALLLAGATAAWAAEPQRDPFMFGPRPGGEPVEDIQVPAVPGPVLIGVLWDAERPLAVLGEEPTAAGQEVAGWLIVEISPNGITIERHGQRRSLEPGERIPPAP